MCLILKVSNFLFLPNKLKTILVSELWIKTGVGVDLDLKYIFQNFNLSGFPPFIDIKTMEIIKGTKTPNLEFLASRFFNVKYKKTTSSVSNWAVDFSEKQIIYLAEDAYHSFILGIEFLPLTVDFNILPFDKNSEVIICNEEENYKSRLVEILQKTNINMPKETFTVEDKLSDKKINVITFRSTCTFNGKEYISFGSSKIKASNSNSLSIIKDNYNFLI